MPEGSLAFWTQIPAIFAITGAFARAARLIGRKPSFLNEVQNSMKGKFLSVMAAMAVMAGSMALAGQTHQDHDKDSQTTHTVVHKTTRYIHHRGGSQSVTYYHYSHKRGDSDDRKHHHRKHRNTKGTWYNVVTHRHRSGATSTESHETSTGRMHNDHIRRHAKSQDEAPGQGKGQALMIPSTGFHLAYYQSPKEDHRQGKNSRRHGMAAAGLYRDLETWHKSGQEFKVRYSLNLSSEGHANLDIKSMQDRNMPNNDANTDPHGELLRYMHSGHDVIQTGTWTQNGSDVTVQLDHIRYGRTQRSKSETLHGHLSGGVLSIDNFDKDFYGTDSLTFHEAT